MLNVDSQMPMKPEFGADGVCILESRHGRGFEMDETREDFFKVLYPFRGSGWLIAGRSRHRLNTGDVILIPPRVLHRITDSSPLALYIVCTQSEFVNRIPEATISLGRLSQYSQPIWGREMAGLIRSLLIEQSRRMMGSPAWMTALTWQILGLIWRAGRTRQKTSRNERSPALVARERVTAYLRELPQRFHEENDLDSAASRAGLSRRRFTQLFQELAGESWLQVIRRLRIGHAQNLLSETGHSVTAIAFQAGFDDLSHFYRVFRTCSNGLTPEAWRRKPGNALVTGTLTAFCKGSDF